jgi:fructose-1,6-bisphosphatase/inositol monophosphatase family enzyme
MSVPTVRVLGAVALDLCLVGTGGLDGYLNPNASSTMPFGERVVDYAAAAVFTLAAGGVVTDAEGAPLTFPADPTHRSAVVAAGTPALHGELLSLLAAGRPGVER